MHWLPEVKDIGAELKAISSDLNSKQTSDKIEALAHHNLDYLQTIQVDLLLSRYLDNRPPSNKLVKLAVLSSSTIKHLLPAMRVASLRRGVLLDIYEAPYGQYRQLLLDPHSALRLFQPDILLFSLSPRELLADIALGTADDVVEQIISAYVEELESLWQMAESISNGIVIQQTYLNTEVPLFGSLDRTLPSTPRQVVRQLNDILAAAAKTSGVLLLDIEHAVESDGLHSWFDQTKWLQAKIEISPAAANKYGELISRLIAAQRGLSKKCLMLDLDNTVWGGIIGDDGIDNIILGEGSALGEAYLDFQRYVKRLSQRGVILAVCSKNEQETATAAFSDHPEMVLSLDDIAVFVANWNDKATNITSIAKQLNIGLESIVFADDNPAERELVRQHLPMVAVPELPNDPSQYVRCLSDAGYFESVTLTDNDMQRTSQYAANNKRESIRAEATSLDDYLASLDMHIQSGPFQSIDMPRVEQLINKTNQFNTTTRRRSRDEIQSIASINSNLTLQVRLSDRFGDNGLVSAVILLPGTEDGTYDIETWVMSCRVFGRQLEFEILNKLADEARSSGAKYLSASYIPSAKNKPVEALYSKLGFSAITLAHELPNNETRWKLDLSTYTPHITYIREAA